LSALTGNQAIQVEAGLDAIYLSGWQVAADANVAGKCTLTNLYILRTAFH
jgi:isocitrate lyase